MSADVSPMCGSAGAVLSILTARTEPSSPSTGRPVNGERAAGSADSVGGTLTLATGSGDLEPPQAATVARTDRAAAEARTVRVKGVLRARRGVITPVRVRGLPA